MTQRFRSIPVLLLALLAGCNDPNAIPNATIPNVLDTVTLWSLDGGPLDKPTAYSLNSRRGVRTWEAGNNYEFIYTVDPAGRSYLLPLQLAVPGNPDAVHPGLKPAAGPFDQMTKAPQNNYITEDSVPAAEGQFYYLRTGVNTCSGLGVPLYGKLELLDIDTALQTITFRTVVDQNCGYRGLRLGIPGS
jgi:hypothetical protein